MKKLPQLVVVLPKICLLLTLITIPATQSRAALLGIVAGSLYVLSKKYEFANIKKYLDQYRIIYVFLTIFIIGAAWLGYSLKNDSADGRFLIWKNSIQLGSDNFFFGSGHGGFQANYMNQQAEYFRSSPESKYIAVADNVQFAFNEFLQLFIEEGILGILLVIVAILSIVSTKNNSPIIVGAKSGILSILVFSLFSYPMQILPLQLNLVLFTAIIASYQTKSYFCFNFSSLIKKSIVKYVIIVCLLTICIWGAARIKELYNGYKSWATAGHYYRLGNYKMAVANFEKAKFIFEDNGAFLTQYGKTLSMLQRNNDALTTLEKAAKKSNSTVVQIGLGDSYRRLGAYKLAEKSYLTAYYMVPSRMYPLYLLANLYQETGKHNLATEMAKALLRKHAKIESEATNQMREEMNRLLQEKDDNR